MFIDSVIWIGAKLERDQWHGKSKIIIQEFLNRKIKTAYVTDYIVLESVNFLLRKAGFNTALETLNLFRNHERIRILNVNGKLFDETCKIFSTYPGLSFTDASIVAAMHSLGINVLYSFDEGFNKINWIERRE